MTRLNTQGGGETEGIRLEQLWMGGFGDAYIDRNLEAGKNRGRFWETILSRFAAKRVLEVGCNAGANLQWICRHVPLTQVYGVDISEHALELLRGRMPGVNAIWSPARSLPFHDGCFDLVFTAGVLIHQPDATLPIVMAEIYRCSRQYVLAIEYFSEDPLEVPYRGQRGALFKRDYGGLYREIFPHLTLCEQGILTHDQGWDDVTFWLFEKPR